MYIFYPDVYFFSQTVTGIFALLIVRCVFDSKVNKRTILGMGAGFGVCSTILVIFIHPFSIYCLVVHILVIPTMIMIIFGVNDRYEFLRKLVTSYVAIWLLYGCMEWITIQTGWSGNLLLCGSSVCLYLAVFLAIKIKRRQEKEVNVILKHKKAELLLKGYIDTGNFLVDPYCDKPVHVVSQDVISEFFRRAEISNYRLVPYETVSGHEIMKCYTIEKMILCRKKKVVINQAAIGVVTRPILKNGTCKMLLNGSQMEV